MKSIIFGENFLQVNLSTIVRCYKNVAIRSLFSVLNFGFNVVVFDTVEDFTHFCFEIKQSDQESFN